MLRRLILHITIIATIAASAQSVAARECREATITAYAAEDFPGVTAIGVRTWPNVGEIVAGGAAYELGQTVHIEGLGNYTVADRGHLGWSQIDLLVATHAEAVRWGRQTRTVCG